MRHASAFLAAMLAAAPGVTHGQTVGLNHFYTNVSPETYRAIEASEFIKQQFATFEKRTTVRRDRTYSGIYLYGDNTYFEFFEAGTGNSPTPTGIALGAETPGTLNKLAAEWKQKGVDSELLTITRRLEQEDIPWFVSLTPAKLSMPSVRLWSMEYLPDFLARWNEAATPHRGIARAQVLARYSAVLQSAPKLMRDVTWITIALSFAETETFMRTAELLGARREGRDLLVEGLRIHPIPPLDSQIGIRQIRMNLRDRTTPPQRIKLGTSVLEISGDGTAVWHF